MRVEAVATTPELEVDAEIVETVLRSELCRLGRLAALKHLLGKRRPVIRKPVLLAGEHERTFVPRAPERLGGSQAGKARAHDHDALERRRHLPPCTILIVAPLGGSHPVPLRLRTSGPPPAEKGPSALSTALAAVDSEERIYQTRGRPQWTVKAKR